MVFLCPFLGFACLWDYSFRRIPQVLQMSIFGFGILNAFITGSWAMVAAYFAKVLLVGAVFGGLFRLGMIGGADVKLLAVSSAFFKGSGMLYYIFFVFLTGAFIGTVKLVVNRRFAERIKYLGAYIKETGRMAGRRAGPGLYLRDREEKIRNGIAMSGPMLISALMHLGGVY